MYKEELARLQGLLTQDKEHPLKLQESSKCMDEKELATSESN